VEYPVSVEAYPDTTEYPDTSIEEAQVSLLQSFPVWCLHPDGRLIALNLLSAWLWGLLQEADSIEEATRDITDRNYLEIVSQPANFNRIAIPNSATAMGFHRRTTSVVKRMQKKFPIPSVIGAANAFEGQMRAHPLLWSIYEQTEENVDREWGYQLSIIPPVQTPRRSVDTLEFDVRVHAVHEGGKVVAYCAVYQPLGHTASIIQDQHRELIRQYGHQSYVLPVPDLEVYPVFKLDRMWNIVWENETYKHLIGSPTTGRHLLEILFDEDPPAVRSVLDAHGVWQDLAEYAVQYFLRATFEFSQPGHELHDEFRNIMNRLRQLPAFEDILRKAEAADMEIPHNLLLPHPICSVYFPSREGIMLAFTGMVQSLQDTHFNVTLLPENEKTRSVVRLPYLKQKQPSVMQRHPFKALTTALQSVMDQELREYEKWTFLPGYASIGSIASNRWGGPEPMLPSDRAVIGQIKSDAASHTSQLSRLVLDELSRNSGSFSLYLSTLEALTEKQTETETPATSSPRNAVPAMPSENTSIDSSQSGDSGQSGLFSVYLSTLHALAEEEGLDADSPNKIEEEVGVSSHRKWDG
jgi:hypothetical protein